LRNPEILHIKTLDGDWCDKDLVMLHACFQLLTDFVEDEMKNDLTDWQAEENTQNIKSEISNLYNWWKERSNPGNFESIDPAFSDVQYIKDNEMLIRLIDIRKYLWT